MAALAELTVVVEAAVKSGSLITADYRDGLNRTVGAMPGAPGARMTAGNNELLYDGCAVIRDARDALEILYGTSDAAQLQADAARARIADEPALLGVLDAVEVGATLEEMAESTGLARARPARGARAARAVGPRRPRGPRVYVRGGGCAVLAARLSLDRADDGGPSRDRRPASPAALLDDRRLRLRRRRGHPGRPQGVRARAARTA